MMESKPEPELMDSEEQTQAYAEADFSDANECFTQAFFSKFAQWSDSGHLVDLGCGPADICIRLSRRLPNWQLTGIDAGTNMLKRAREAIADSECADRIDLQLSHLPDPGLGERCYQAITSNSLLHHLPDPMVLWHSILQLADTGAAVMIMDLSRPDSTQDARRLVDHYAHDAPTVLRNDFYHSLLAAYEPTEVKQQLHACGLAHFELFRPSDRHWIVFGRTGS